MGPLDKPIIDRSKAGNFIEDLNNIARYILKDHKNDPVVIPGLIDAEIRTIDMAIEFQAHRNPPFQISKDWFVSCAQSIIKILALHGLEGIYKEFPLGMVGFVTTLVQKHQAYGARPIRKWGTFGLLVRIDSKWQRYKNLMRNSIPEGGESIVDTLWDIVGYCCLGYYLVLENEAPALTPTPTGPKAE